MHGWLVAAIREPVVVSLLVLCSLTALMFAAMAEWAPSPRARGLLDAIHGTLRKRGMLKVGAIDMGVSVARISRWLNPSAPNILTRLADLGDEFERDLIAARAADLGLVIVDARLAAALDLVDAHRRRMARMEPQESRTA